MRIRIQSTVALEAAVFLKILQLFFRGFSIQYGISMRESAESFNHLQMFASVFGRIVYELLPRRQFIYTLR